MPVSQKVSLSFNFSQNLARYSKIVVFFNMADMATQDVLHMLMHDVSRLLYTHLPSWCGVGCGHLALALALALPRRWVQRPSVVHRAREATRRKATSAHRKDMTRRGSLATHLGQSGGHFYGT